MALSLGLGSINVVTENGDVYTYGYNSGGQLGIGSCEDQLVPVLLGKQAVFGGRGVVMISAGTQRTACVTIDGGCWTWGTVSNSAYSSTPTAQDLFMMRPSRLGPSNFGNSPVLMVACGSYFTALLTTAGHVWNYGRGLRGELGHGDFQDKNTFTQIDPLRFGADHTVRITMIAAGDEHTLAIGNTGEFLFSWGNADFGSCALGQGDAHNAGIPGQIPPHTHNGMRVSFIAAGNDTSAVITADGVLWSCGRNGFGQLGHGTFGSTNFLRRVGGDEWFGTGGARTAALGYANMLVLTQSKQVWICGNNSGMLPVLVPNATSTSGIEEFQNANITAIDCKIHKLALVTEGGSLYTFGTAVFGRFGFADLERSSALENSIPRLVPNTLLGMARVGQWHRRHQDMALAFAMGSHARLGVGTPYIHGDYQDLISLMFGDMRIQPSPAAGEPLRTLLGFD